jgi:AcrR family transcriptional regulator
MSVEERREQILGLAGRAFAAGPYDDVSTAAIAEAAGISHGLLFHYFPTKNALYVAVVQAAADDILRTSTEVEGDTAGDRLRSGLDAYFAFVEAHPVVYATLLGARSGSDPAVQAIVDATRTAFFASLSRALAPMARTANDKRLQRAALRAWIGFVEALALDSIAHGELSRAEIVRLAIDALLGAAPNAAEILEVH